MNLHSRVPTMAMADPILPYGGLQPKVLHQPRLYAWTSDKAQPIIVGSLSDNRARAIASACAGLLVRTSVVLAELAAEEPRHVLFFYPHSLILFLSILV